MVFVCVCVSCNGIPAQPQKLIRLSEGTIYLNLGWPKSSTSAVQFFLLKQIFRLHPSMYRLPLTVIDDCNLLEVRRIHSQRPPVLPGNAARECCSDRENRSGTKRQRLSKHASEGQCVIITLLTAAAYKSERWRLSINSLIWCDGYSVIFLFLLIVGYSFDPWCGNLYFCQRCHEPCQVSDGHIGWKQEMVAVVMVGMS